MCAETSEDPWEEQRSRLKGDITQFSVAGKWEQSERGGVFVRSFPSFFFSLLVCLPQHVSMCHQSVTKKNENLSKGSLFILQVR